MKPSVEDIVVLSMCACFGHIGLSLTGFGMAIIYWFVWQISVLSGYTSDFKYAVFIQALSVFSAQVSTRADGEVSHSSEFATPMIASFTLPFQNHSLRTPEISEVPPAHYNYSLSTRAAHRRCRPHRSRRKRGRCFSYSYGIA